MTEARDRISDLPDEILHEIFSLVPVKSVAKNSVLSRTWSRRWATLPVLDFNQVCPPTPKRLDHANELQVVLDEQMKALAFIPGVLFSRPENSNINVFRFSGRLMSLSCLEDCICRVVNHRVGELQLNLLMACGERFDLPHCVYECDSLRSLALINATRIRLRSQPEDSKPRFCFSFSLVKATSGLCSLQALTLKCVDILDDDLTADLFSDSSFPFLENLTMKTCRGMTHLKISCSKLKDARVVDMNLNSLDISGSRLENLTVRFCFENPSGDNKSRVNIFAPNLKVFRWQFNGYTDDSSIQNFPRLNAFYMHYWLEDDVSNVIIKNVVKLLSASSQVSVLDIQSFGFLRVLASIYFQGGLPFPFMKLKTLDIFAYGLKRYDIPGLLCLFKSSPVVDTLKIMICPKTTNEVPNWNNILLDNANCTEEQYWEKQAPTLRSILCNIKMVTIYVGEGIEELERAVKMTRFLLEQGTNLQEMFLVVPQSNANNLDTWKDKTGLTEEFRPASPHVKILMTALSSRRGANRTPVQALLCLM